jgi:hypothetical protein
MKKSIIESGHKKKAIARGTVNLSITKSIICFLTTFITLYFSAACKGRELENPIAFSSKQKSNTSAQTLPGGKARFTWVNGNFDTNIGTWQRIVNLTFTASTGTVAATAWTWKSAEKKGKVAFNSHFCTFDGISKTCSTYTPWGWVYPTGQYESWSGTYTYTGTTLSIAWTSPAHAAGTTESWTITNPTTALARASLITSSYEVTHGRGYGSNSSFKTYKTIAQMVPLPNFTTANSRRVQAKATAETATPTITPATGWTKAALNLSTFTTPSSPTPKNTMHYYQPTSSACDPGSCTTTRPGIIYHLSSENNSRHMAYHFFCACLPTAAEFPSYPRNLHPAALSQILDDNNDLVALIGVESQNPPETYYKGAYQYQLFDFNNIP